MHRPLARRGLISNRAGNRVRKRVSATTKTELYQRLKDLKDELAQGVRSSATYTVQAACDDWLASLFDRSPKTVSTLREMLDPLLAKIGKMVLRRRPTLRWPDFGRITQRNKGRRRELAAADARERPMGTCHGRSASDGYHLGRAGRAR